jgi:hypothetical protein
MHEAHGLQSLAGLVLCHLLIGQLAQLFGDQRQELLGSPSVALLNGAKESGDVAHGRGLRVWADAHDYSGSVTP